MFRARFVCAVIGMGCIALAATSAWCAEWPSVLADAQAKCDRQRSAIRDLVIVEDMVMQAEEGAMQAEHTLYRKGERSRIEMTMHVPESGLGDIRTVVIDNGADVWVIHSLTGKQKLPPEQAKQRGEFRECWDFTPENSTVVGSESVNGSDCYLVDMTRDDVKHRLWLEKSTGRVIQGEAHSEGESVRWALSDFRIVFDDYEYPHKIELFDGAQTISTMTVKSITVNSGISDDLFDPDKVEMAQPNLEELMKQMMSGEEKE